MGKGVITCYLLAQWTLGQAPGDLEGEPVSVLWVGFEDSWPEVVLPRLVAAGADADAAVQPARSSPPARTSTWPATRQALGELVDEHGIRVVAFEAMVDHLGRHRRPQERRGHGGRSPRWSSSPASGSCS